MKSINEKMLNIFEGNNENKEKFNNIPISERKIKKVYIIIFSFLALLILGFFLFLILGPMKEESYNKMNEMIKYL